MKNSRKIVVGSALILALSFSTIENSISYAEEDTIKNVETNEIKTKEENNKNLLETPNEELKEDSNVENTEEFKETKDIEESNEPTELKSEESNKPAELKLEESNDKTYTESDYDENYSRVDENQYKHRDQFDDDKIDFNEEEYNNAKAYEKSEEYQKENPYNKIQNIKKIEENKRIEKFDENLDIGFGDGVIAKNSGGLLNDFIKFNYKDDKAYLDNSNNRRFFSISFDDEDFDPSKAGDYEIKATVMSYSSYDSVNSTLRIGDIVENFIRVSVVDDGNNRVMYDSEIEAINAANEIIESNDDFNFYRIIRDGNKYSYELAYHEGSHYKKYKELKHDEYDDYLEDWKSHEEFKEMFKEDIHKYDEESQKYINSVIHDGFYSSKPLSKEEFGEKLRIHNSYAEGKVASKNFQNRIIDNLNLLPQYDYKDLSLKEKINIDSSNEINLYNANLEVGNKLPHLKKLVEFNFSEYGPRVNYSWDPDSIDTNKLGKQNLDVKFTYRNSKGEEEEFTKTLVINIVDSSKQDPDTDQTLDKKGLEKEISEENSIDPKDFTEESYQNYKASLAAAKNILNKKDAKQEELDKALEELKESRDNLVKVNSDKENQADKNNDNKYTAGKNDDNQNTGVENNDNKKENSKPDGENTDKISKEDSKAEVNEANGNGSKIDKNDKTDSIDKKNNDKKISDNKVDNKTIKEEDKTEDKEKIKPVKVSEIKQSSNVKTGVTGLAGVIGALATAVGGYFFTKKNK